MSPVEFGLALLLVIGAIFTWNSLKTRERANRIAREFCRDSGHQFLDGSVGFATLGLQRHAGRLAVRRVYLFDFAEGGVERRQAALIFIGARFHNLVLLES